MQGQSNAGTHYKESWGADLQDANISEGLYDSANRQKILHAPLKYRVTQPALYSEDDRLRILEKFKAAGVDGLMLPHCNFGTEYLCARLAKDLLCCQFRQRYGGQLDIEAFQQLPLVTHRRPEVKGTGTDLQDEFRHRVSLRTAGQRFRRTGSALGTAG